ncbi:hypothetical protein F5984_15115 [Rudanella paleaurantiibacter]|uniref:Uncharacterized protein n=1 Tax=Rudanella paleaurantiibacter TaxID=2614655 RepID=A0A7J5U1J8_9BACT|nr:hypothetical protein [Rudanella paleaurantiibacter]KAB7730470.1 hypothetical protein F5984_15115 [Rudanella paleaurantiibacter]
MQNSTVPNASSVEAGPKRVYLSTLATGDYFYFALLPHLIYKVVRKYPNVFVIKLIDDPRAKRISYYPRPADIDQNKVCRIRRPV